MDIRTYKSIMSEIEELAKEPEKNSERLKELTEELAKQEKILANVNVDYINAKIVELENKKESFSKDENLSAEEKFKNVCTTELELRNYRTILDEKNLYTYNQDKIKTYLEANYGTEQVATAESVATQEPEESKKSRILTFKRGLKTVAVLGAIALLAFGIHSCNHKNTADKSITASQDDKDKEEPTTEDNGNKKDDTKSDDEKSEDTKETKDNDSDKDTKDEKEDNTTEKASTKDDNNDSVGKNNTTDTTGTGTGSSTSTTGGTGTDTATNEGSTTTTLPEEVEDVPTEGNLSIEPTVEIDKSTIPTITPGTTIDEVTPTVDPDINNVTDTGSNEETTPVKDNSTSEPEGTKGPQKQDEYVEETTPIEKPDLTPETITETPGTSTEVVNEIHDNSSTAEPEGTKGPQKQDEEEVEESPIVIPDLTDDYIIESGTESEVEVDEEFCLSTSANTYSFSYQPVEETESSSISSEDELNDLIARLQEIINENENSSINYSNENGNTFEFNYEAEPSDYEVPEINDDTIMEEQVMTSYGPLTYAPGN